MPFCGPVSVAPDPKALGYHHKGTFWGTDLRFPRNSRILDSVPQNVRLSAPLDLRILVSAESCKSKLSEFRILMSWLFIK